MKIGIIKSDTPEAQPHMIPKVEKTPKIDIRVEITSKHKYNIRASTKIFNHVTTLKKAPKHISSGSNRKNENTHRNILIFS